MNWVPFASRFDNPRDVILNGIVFGIFGYLFARAFPANRPSVTLARAWILAAVLSASVEFYQVFSHGRFANMTDFVMNNAGVVLGVAVERLRSGWRRWQVGAPWHPGGE